MRYLKWTARGVVGASTALSLIVLGTAVGGVGAAAASSSWARSSSARDTVTVAYQKAIANLTEDADTATPGASQALSLVADSLWQRLPTGKLAPDLASSASHSATGLTWTFHLRKGIKFSNGHPVTSADVKFTYEYEAQQPLQGSSYKTITNIATPNPSTVVFTTKAPDVTFLTTAASYNVAIIPKTFAGEPKTIFWKKPIGDGAFTVASFHAGNDVVLKRNPKYFDASKIKAKQITIQTVTDANTAALKLQNGDVNSIFTVPNSEVDSLGSRPGVSVRRVPNGAAYFLIANTKTGPLGNLDVRKAISLAVNRSDMVKSALLGHGTIAASWLADTLVDGYQPPFGKEHSLSKAKALLAKTPYANGFSVTFPYTSSNPTDTDLAEVVETNLAALHIKVVLQGESADQLGTALTNHKFGLSTAYIEYAGDPGAVFGYYTATTGFYSQGPNVKALTAMLSKALSVFNNTQRMQDYKNLVRYMATTSSMIGLVQPYTYMATAGNVANVVRGAGWIYYKYTTFK